MISFLIFLLVFLILSTPIVIFLYWLVGGFTIVKEGTVKIIVRFGEYRESLMVKKGYKIDENNQIVPLAEGEEEETGLLWGGLRIVGIPFIDKVFKKDLKWVKSLPEGTLEDRFESKVDFLLADVHYQYGLRFNNIEDKELLPLSGQMTLTASIVNPYKAQFGVKDWFAAVVNRVLPVVREYIPEHTYEEIINDPAVQLDKDVMTTLRTSGILEELENYGVRIHALETVDINPGEKFRDMTLQRKIGRMNADQAVEETAGRVLESVARTSGMTLDELKADLKANPKKRGLSSKDDGYKEAFAYAEDQVKRDRAGAAGELTDIRVGNTDGSSFKDPTLGSLIGGLAAVASKFGKGGGKSKKGKSSGEKDKKEDFLLEDEE